MSQKISSKKAVDSKTSQPEVGFVHPKTWSYIRFFYDQNKQLWQRCAQYEADLKQIKETLKLVA